MSHTLARPLVRDLRLLRQESTRAFTLIELLAVIGIIGILSAITFGIIKGVNERAAIGQAKAELASLAQSLEEYKRQYGDYPQISTSTPAKFLQSLIGKYGPTGVSITNGKSFIEVSKFTASADPFNDTTATLQDPWGRNYNYYYKTTWTNKTYVLYSYGPTIGATSAATTEPTNAQPNATTGIVDYTNASNLDNIYANQN